MTEQGEMKNSPDPIRLTPEQGLLAAIFGEALTDFTSEKFLLEPPVRSSRQLLKDQMYNVLNELTNEEKTVLRMRFDLDNSGVKTFKEISAAISKSETTARRREKRALQKLRHPRRSERLKEFLELPPSPSEV